jgi:hypothetical protein
MTRPWKQLLRKCPLCGYKFCNSLDRNAHMNEQCPKRGRIPQGGEPWTCQGGLPSLGKRR